MAGSESYTNWEGIQYDAVIAAIRATPAMTPQQVSDKIASTALGDSDTYSSVALDARFTTVLTALDQLAVAMKNGLPTYRSAYMAARRATQLYSGNIEFDLWHMAYNVKAKVADPTIKAKCDALMTAVAADVTVNWISSSKQVKNSHGLAVWWPATARRAGPVIAPTRLSRTTAQMRISRRDVAVRYWDRRARRRSASDRARPAGGEPYGAPPGRPSVPRGPVLHCHFACVAGRG